MNPAKSFRPDPVCGFPVWSGVLGGKAYSTALATLLGWVTCAGYGLLTDPAVDLFLYRAPDGAYFIIAQAAHFLSAKDVFLYPWEQALGFFQLMLRFKLNLVDTEGAFPEVCF